MRQEAGARSHNLSSFRNETSSDFVAPDGLINLGIAAQSYYGYPCSAYAPGYKEPHSYQSEHQASTPSTMYGSDFQTSYGNNNVYQPRHLAPDTCNKYELGSRTSYVYGPSRSPVQDNDLKNADFARDKESEEPALESVNSISADNIFRTQKAKSKPPADNGPPLQFPCLHPSCDHVSARSSDLQRHMQKHNLNPPEEKYGCPIRGCGRVGIHGFNRKDHLTEHLRNFHIQDMPQKERCEEWKEWQQVSDWKSRTVRRRYCCGGS